MLSNFVHLLMVLAIFNPFCCCTAAGLFADGSEVAAIPSCCESTGDQQSSQDQHDPENCPHKALEDFEIASYKDAGTHNSTFSLLPVLFVVRDLLVYEPVVELTHPKMLESVLGAPPVSLSQVYCVYRI